MKRTAKQFRQTAWTTLTGRYWWAVLAALIAIVLGGSSSIPSLGFSFDSESVQHLQDFVSSNEPVSRAVLWVFGTIGVFIAMVSIALFIIGGAVELGHNLFNISLYTGSGNPPMSTLFSRFSILGRALWLRVLMWLKTFAWSLLFIVPGIIAAYRYAMAPYIMAEHPELTASEAIEQSKTMMNGNKGRLFCLGFSFIGWILLAALTCGIGTVFLAPYIKAANTAFYMELTGRLPDGPQQEAPAAAPQSL